MSSLIQLCIFSVSCVVGAWNAPASSGSYSRRPLSFLSLKFREPLLSHHIIYGSFQGCNSRCCKFFAGRFFPCYSRFSNWQSWASWVTTFGCTDVSLGSLRGLYVVYGVWPHQLFCVGFYLENKGHNRLRAFVFYPGVSTPFICKLLKSCCCLFFLWTCPARRWTICLILKRFPFLTSPLLCLFSTWKFTQKQVYPLFMTCVEVTGSVPILD